MNLTIRKDIRDAQAELPYIIKYGF